MRTPLRRHIAQHAPAANRRKRCECSNCPTTVYPVYVIPGSSEASEEDTMRLTGTHHRKPDYIPASATYVRWPTPDEFVGEHPRPNPRRVRTMIGVALGAVLAFLLLAFVAHRATAHPAPPTPEWVTPAPTPAPSTPPTSGNFTTMPSIPDVIRLDIIWTRSLR